MYIGFVTGLDWELRMPTAPPVHRPPGYTKRKPWQRIGTGRHLSARPWGRLRKQVLLRDHYTCQACGLVSEELEVDHVIPRAQGGGDSLENLQALCLRCHQIKTQHESRVGRW